MTVALSGMSLHTNNDNESGWGGTDGPDDYNNAEQGSNSESWQVSKNATETGTLTKSSALNTARGLFSFWQSSNLAPYYTDIKLDLQSSANNYKQFTVANSTNKLIGGNFVPSVVDYVNKGAATGTFAPASFSALRIILNNSSSGNIRSVINNWIDAMYYGPGHTISGTTTGDKLFAEAAAVDELTANKYGIMWNYNGIIYSQGDIDLSGTALTSDNETLVFIDTLNGYDTYNLDITNTVTFKGTSIIAAGSVDFIFDTTSATAFSMTGGGLNQAANVLFAAGQTIKGITVLVSGEVDPNGATFENSTIDSTTETITGAITFTDSADISNTKDIQIKNFNGKYGVYIPASITGTITLNGFISDGSGTDIYWAATGGTLTVNMTGGTNFTTKATGGGTISLENTVALTIDAPVSLVGAEIRIYDLDDSPVGSLGTELAGGESHNAATYLYSGSGSNVIWIQIMLDGYVEFGQSLTMPSSDGTFTALLVADLNA